MLADRRLFTLASGRTSSPETYVLSKPARGNKRPAVEENDKRPVYHTSSFTYDLFVHVLPSTFVGIGDIAEQYGTAGTLNAGAPTWAAPPGSAAGGGYAGVGPPPRGTSGRRRSPLLANSPRLSVLPPLVRPGDVSPDKVCALLHMCVRAQHRILCMGASCFEANRGVLRLVRTGLFYSCRSSTALCC